MIKAKEAHSVLQGGAHYFQIETIYVLDKKNF